MRYVSMLGRGSIFCLTILIYISLCVGVDSASATGFAGEAEGRMSMYAQDKL